MPPVVEQEITSSHPALFYYGLAIATLLVLGACYFAFWYVAVRPYSDSGEQGYDTWGATLQDFVSQSSPLPQGDYSNPTYPSTQMPVGNASNVTATGTDECMHAYWETLRPAAEQQIINLHQNNPSLTIIETSLDIFYSSSLRTCVAGNFARIEGAYPVNATDFPDAYFESDDDYHAVIGFFFTPDGVAIKPNSPQWNVVKAYLQTLAENRRAFSYNTPTSDEECKVAYQGNLNAAIENVKQPGETVSASLFFSKSLGYCVGLILAESGNVHNWYSFNASNGDVLSSSDSVVAIEEYSSRQ
jgi:hypothetical protein